MPPNCPTYIPVLIALAAFGCLYNSCVEALQRHGHDRGYMAFIVAAGVTATLAASALINGIQPTLWTFLCFAASGLPMIAGSVKRHLHARDHETRQILKRNGEIIDKET